MASEKKTSLKKHFEPEQWKAFSHVERRRFCKKQRRHYKRSSLAKERESHELEEKRRLESIPGYLERLREEERLEEERQRHEEIERQYHHELWLRREALAQAEFKRKKKAEEKAARAREERELLIKQEWEALKKKEEEEKERKAKDRQAKEERLKEALTADQRDQTDEDTSWRNPLAPDDLNVTSEGTTGRDASSRECSFYMKTGACRFGDRCSKFHPKPESSCTILVPGMFQDIALSDISRLEDRDNDASLEFDEGEMYERFVQFFEDVLPEFQKLGNVVQFKVCCNHEAHLRGNVYVQFSNEQDAVEAYKVFNGRWYALRQLSCQFVPIRRWRSAICGQFQRSCCPKGNNCNFLHVFQNPGNAFWRADRDFPFQQPQRDYHRSRRGSSSQRGSPTRDGTPNHLQYRHRRRRYSSPSQHDHLRSSTHDNSGSSGSDESSYSRDSSRSQRKRSRRSNSRSSSRKRHRHVHSHTHHRKHRRRDTSRNSIPNRKVKDKEKSDDDHASSKELQHFEPNIK